MNVFIRASEGFINSRICRKRQVNVFLIYFSLLKNNAYNVLFHIIQEVRDLLKLVSVDTCNILLLNKCVFGFLVIFGGYNWPQNNLSVFASIQDRNRLTLFS